MTASHYTIDCIEAAVRHLSDSLREGTVPSLAEAARASNFSKYHFHRMFRLVTGETYAQAVTRLRLARGAQELEKGDSTVTEAALSAGYSTSQAFAKAVKRQIGQTASALSADPERLASAISSFSVPSDATGGADLAVELVSLEPFTVIAKPTHGLYPELNETYYHLFEAAGAPEAVRAILGWPHDDLDADDLTFVCGLAMTAAPGALPQGIDVQDIDEGRFLRLRHTGTYDGLGATLDQGYRLLLDMPDHRIADRPCLFHYLDDPEEVAEADLRTDVHIPVVRAD